MQKLLATLSRQIEIANERKDIRSSGEIDTYAQGLAAGRDLEHEDTPPTKRRRVERGLPQVENHSLLQRLLANSFSLAHAKYSENLEDLGNAIS